jgi:hypothetical protein
VTVTLGKGQANEGQGQRWGAVGGMAEGADADGADLADIASLPLGFVDVTLPVDNDIDLTYFIPSKLCTTYSCVYSQSKNHRKIHVNFAKHMFKTCGRNFQLSPLPIFFQKRSK